MENAIDIPFRKTRNACIFSVLLDLDLRRNWSSHRHLSRFRAFAEYPGRPASLSVRGYTAANSADRQPGVGEIAQSSSFSSSGLSPPFQIAGHYSVQLGLKLMLSTSRAGAPDIGVPEPNPSGWSATPKLTRTASGEFEAGLAVLGNPNVVTYYRPSI